MAGYRIPGINEFVTEQQYYNYVKEKNDMALTDVANIMNGNVNEQVKENTNMEETNVMMNIDELIKQADKEVDSVLKGNEHRLEGQGLKDVFGDVADIDKLAIHYKKGTSQADNETYGVILFKKVDEEGHQYFTFVSGKVRDKIQVMVTAAGGESQLNYIIKQQGLKAKFGNKVVKSDDGLHTNVKIWFEA